MNTFCSDLKGKVGIITGGTSGFGFEIVKSLLVQGANLAVFSMDELSSESLENLNRLGISEAAYFHQDILAKNAADDMVNKTVEKFGKLDFVIANAGLAYRFEEPLLSMPTEKIVEAMENQFRMFPIALTTLAVRAAEVMAPAYRDAETNESGHRVDSGSIVITLSVGSLIPIRDDLIAYSAAKRAARSVMDSLAGTLGPENIRVNAIAPGFANTAGPKKFYDRFPEIHADIEAANHLKPSFMHPSAVVPAVLYLLTDNYVTGQCIVLDGGFTNNMRCYFQDS